MSFIEYTLNLIYPAKCLLCEELIPLHSEDRLLCSSCLNDMPWINGKRCKRCGRAVKENEGEFCLECENHEFAFERGYAVFPYHIAKNAIFHFKYDGFKPDGYKLAEIMANYAMDRDCGGLFDADLIIPVPLHRKKEKQRGFNQAAILAEEVGKRLGIKYDGNIVRRRLHTTPQSELTPRERKSNLKEAFEVVNKNDICYKKIIIVDDIFTTGATINTIARLLMTNGAREVWFFTLSIA